MVKLFIAIKSFFISKFSRNVQEKEVEIKNPPPEVKKVDKTFFEKVWEVAIQESGVKEISGSRDNARIVEYHKATTLKATDDETPWCSAFVSWCIEKAGYESTRDAWARSYLNWGKKLDAPVKGCVVVFSRGASSGHVAFFYKIENEMVYCLGGNQGNEVNISAYPSWRVLGYRSQS